MPEHPLHDLPVGPEPPERLNVIVEIPRGSRNKYELDRDSGLIRFDRLLYSAVHYPGDYGFIPRTLARDGDPLDALVMVTEPTFAGCLIVVRPVGVFVMEDEKGMDEKLLAVPVADPLYREYRGLEQVAPHFLREVEHFFTVYKDLEGLHTRIVGWSGLEEALEVLGDATERYGEDAGGPAPTGPGGAGDGAPSTGADPGA